MESERRNVIKESSKVSFLTKHFRNMYTCKT